MSVWTPGGRWSARFYGPTEYGGGGTLDPQDRASSITRGWKFRLDWKAGSDVLTRVYARPDPLLEAHYGPFSPDTPLYPAGRTGRRYFTSCYTHTPTHGDVAFVWLDEARAARLVAAVGDAHSWPVLREPAFRRAWPAGTTPEAEHPRPEGRATFAWTDGNGDGRPQPDEVQFIRGGARGVTVMNDLAVIVSRLGDQAVRFAAACDEGGLPRYSLRTPQPLGPAGGVQPSSGGNQALADSGGWTVYTNAPTPLSPYGLGGAFKGEPCWSYPASGRGCTPAARPPCRMPGMVIGHTRLLGGLIDSPVGPLFGINGNMGNMYLLAPDGLFVGTLFHDIRLRPQLGRPGRHARHGRDRRVAAQRELPGRA
ncbi:MAG: hypothetical protein U0736_21025 [Gemmataceae bacterium]